MSLACIKTTWGVAGTGELARTYPTQDT